MTSKRRITTRATVALLAVAAAAASVVATATGTTSIKPYVVPIGDDYEIKALFSVDDRVPLLDGAPGQQYRMVGIPDGLGAHPNGDGTSTLYMNHELPSTSLSQPVVGGPRTAAPSSRAGSSIRTATRLRASVRTTRSGRRTP